MRRPKVSFGPVVTGTEGEPGLTAKCCAGGIFCTFLWSNMCRHGKEPRKIDGAPVTPEWCEMRESALADAAAIHR